MLKLAIVGSRDIQIRPAELSKIVFDIYPKTTEVVSGGARGIDTCGATYAKFDSLKLKVLCYLVKHWR